MHYNKEISIVHLLYWPLRWNNFKMNFKVFKWEINALQ